MKIIEESWVDFRGNNTTALSLDKDGLYSVSEFIALLEVIKKKFGDKKILIHDSNSNILGGFSHIYLNHRFDEREIYGEDYFEDDTICIYG